MFQVGCSGRLCELGRSQAIILSKLVKEHGHVYAFDAIPENISVFEDYIQRHNIGNINVIHLGLWKEPGKIEFDVPEDPEKRVTTGSRPKLVREEEPSRFDGIRSLPVETIDNIIQQFEIYRLDFLNITTNGSEPEIIEGGFNTISKHRPLISTPGETKNISNRLKKMFADIDYEVHENTTKLHVFGKPFKELWMKPL